LTRFGVLVNDAKKFLRGMKAVALAKGRYCTVLALIKSASRSGGKNIACSVARANALNVHVVTHA